MSRVVAIDTLLSPHLSLGEGVGLRPVHYAHVLKNKPKLGFFEAIAENFIGIRSGAGGRPIAILEKLRGDYPVALHGVALSVGSTDPLDFDYLKKIKALYARIEPVIVSDHLCWTGVDGENLHDLLPLPYTEEAVRHVSAKIAATQDFLGRRLLFENVSSYLTFTDSEMAEWEFISEIAKRSGCGVLLDVNNIHVSAINHGFAAMDFIRGISVSSVGQIHLAGYEDHGDYLIDTHDHPVAAPVWDLYAAAIERFGDVPTLIEWDDKIPPFAVLADEAARATKIKREVLSRKAKSA